jgi:hypothetical protein
MSSKTNKSTSINTSIITKLKDQQLINDQALVMIGSLSLEDLIAVKLELTCNNLNNRFYGFDIWRQTGYIVKEALLKFAISTTNSKKSAARFLGLTYDEFKKHCIRYSIDI